MQKFGATRILTAFIPSTCGHVAK